MASEIVRRLYRKAREADTGCVVGEHALSAWRAARILRRWQALEEMGLVRLRDVPDTDWEPDCCCGSKKCMSSPEYEGDEVEAFGSIGEYRLPADEDEWQYGGSCWGHVGYRDVLDWRENPHILDIMEETIDAFRYAWKDLVHRKHCPMCRQIVNA